MEKIVTSSKKTTGRASGGNHFILNFQHIQSLTHEKAEVTAMRTNSKNSDSDKNVNSHESGDDKDSDWENSVEVEDRNEEEGLDVLTLPVFT